MAQGWIVGEDVNVGVTKGGAAGRAGWLYSEGREWAFTAGSDSSGSSLQDERNGRGGRIQAEKGQLMALAGADGEADDCAPCLERALHMGASSTPRPKPWMDDSHSG